MLTVTTSGSLLQAERVKMAAIVAAALHAGRDVARTHQDKAAAASWLAAEQGLPDIEELLDSLNEAKKAAAYDAFVRETLDPEEIASEVESYVDETREDGRRVRYTFVCTVNYDGGRWVLEKLDLSERFATAPGTGPALAVRE